MWFEDLLRRRQALPALLRRAAEAALTAWQATAGAGHNNAAKPRVLRAGTWVELWVGQGAARTQALVSRANGSTVCGPQVPYFVIER